MVGNEAAGDLEMVTRKPQRSGPGLRSPRRCEEEVGRLQEDQGHQPSRLQEEGNKSSQLLLLLPGLRRQRLASCISWSDTYPSEREREWGVPLAPLPVIRS